jgi:hypothetical protein
MPGVLIIEAIFQASLLLVHATTDHSRSWRRMCGHSSAANLLFRGSSAVFLVLAISTWLYGFPLRDRNPDAWDYTILNGAFATAVSSPGSLGVQVGRATTEGWEIVSTGADPSGGAFVILRRPKK